MREPFRLEAFLPFRLNVVATEISERLSAIYGPEFGIDIPQWRILANLAARGEATAQAIARAALLHKSTVSRAVSDLASRGLVERLVSARDKRALRLRLTPEGRKLFRSLAPVVLAFEAELMSELTEMEGRALLRGLAGLEQALRATREKAA